MFVGIDFGTTNSAIGIADGRGEVQLVPLTGASYWRTVLFFEPGGGLTAGAPAIARYLETNGVTGPGSSPMPGGPDCCAPTMRTPSRTTCS